MKYALAIAVLILLASNAYWLYVSVDQASINKYMYSNLYEASHTACQSLAFANELATGMSKQQIIDAAINSADHAGTNQEGLYYHGWLAFKFDDKNELLHISGTIDNYICSTGS